MTQTTQRINRISIYKSPVKLKEPFIISLGPLTHAENCVVKIETDGGITGFGECSPFRTIHGESMDSCFEHGKFLARQIAGNDATDTEGCMQIMDACMTANTSIKSAIDIALHDIAAQAANIPLYAFLKGDPGKKMFTDYTVSLNGIEKMVADALWIKKQGFKTVKVKLGGDKDMDVARIAAIREAIGMDLALRIDANQGWQVQDASGILQRLQPFNIQHCEEPVSKALFMHLPGIRATSPIPIMADESCFDHVDAERLIQLGACDMFNIKLGKSSGIGKAQKIATLAERAGMQVQAGGFLESRLGFTATAHVALSSPCIQHFDFDTPLMFEEDPVAGGISYGHNGEIMLPSGNGLGAVFKEEYLSQLEHWETFAA